SPTSTSLSIRRKACLGVYLIISIFFNLSIFNTADCYCILLTKNTLAVFFFPWPLRNVCHRSLHPFRKSWIPLFRQPLSLWYRPLTELRQYRTYPRQF